MAKKSDIALLLPPRYARNDPRNQRRVKAGQLLSMKLGGYDYPIRKLRRAGDNPCVTLPPQVRESLGIKLGDWLMFGEGPWDGCAWMCRVTEEQYKGKRASESVEFKRKARKVRGKRQHLFVTVGRAVRNILKAEVGDYISFGLEPEAGVISVCAVKGGNGQTGRRRTG